MRIQYRRDLWKLFEHLDPSRLEPVVEVGVAEGNFSEDILRWPVEFPVVYLVDRWTCVPTVKGDSANKQEWHDANFNRVVERTKPFGDRAQILHMESADAARKFPDHSLAMVYIDADHSYEGVCSDIACWIPKVIAGGYMAFHDYLNPAYGVKKAVDQFCSSCGRTPVVMQEDKPEDAGAYFKC